MRFKAILFVILCSFFLTACTFTKEKEPSGTLSSINLFLYRTDSIKSQPELIDVTVDPESLNSTVSEIDKAEPANIPEADRLDRIYILQLSYESNGAVVETKYFLYILDDSQNHYIKPFDMTSDYNVDKYDTRQKETILRMIGTDNWKRLSTSILNS